MYRMVKTRSMRRTKRQIYRIRVKSSVCRKLSKDKCRKKNGCKSTKKGRRRSYCRSMKNRSA